MGKEQLTEPDFQGNAPIKEGEVFSARHEILKLKNFPRSQRGQELGKFEEKFAFQQEGLARLQDSIIEKIYINPDIGFEKLFDEVKRNGANFGMNPEQENIAKKLLEEYTRRHAKVNEYREKYSDDRALFGQLFGREPRGKIKIITGPMTFFVQCFDPEDYVMIYTQNFLEDAEVTQDQIDAAKISGAVSIGTCLIPELKGTILAENTSEIREEYEKYLENIKNSDLPENYRAEVISGINSLLQKDSAKRYMHEEQHAIKRLFAEESFVMVTADQLKSAKTKGEMELIYTRYLRFLRAEGPQAKAKNEILAYFKEGRGPKDVYKSLIEKKEKGGKYDFVSGIKKSAFSNLVLKIGERVNGGYKVPDGFENEFEKSFKKIFGKEYREGLKIGINSIIDLGNAGYSKGEVLALLIVFPFYQWPRIARRLIKYRARREGIFAFPDYTSQKSLKRSLWIGRRLDLKKKKKQ